MKAVRAYVQTHLECEAVVISAQIESELIDLSEDEAKEFRRISGVSESGTGSLIRATYHLLGLRTHFTAGERKLRAGPSTSATPAPKAAGVIHLISNAVSSRSRPSRMTISWRAALSRTPAREGSLPHGRQGEYVRRDGDVRSSSSTCSGDGLEVWARPSDTVDVAELAAHVGDERSDIDRPIPSPSPAFPSA